jgi:hypothetical protein
MNRPTGVTVLSILAFIAGAFTLIAGLLLTLMGTAIGSMGGPVFAAIGAFAGVIFLVLGALYFLVGFGLWTLKPWAWMLTVILCGIGLALNLVQALSGDVVGGTFGLIVNGFVLWYMMRPHVKTAFGRA